MEENTIPSVFDELEQERPSMEYATTGQRFVNYLIDMLVFYAFNYATFYLLGFVIVYFDLGWYDFVVSTLGTYAITYLNLVVYYTLIEGATKGRTLGKLATRTRAVAEDLRPIGWKMALLRSLCRLIPFETFSGLGGYPWHDKITKTWVVKKTSRPF